jgi:anti-sigma factor (TIGR02949 family)
MVQQKIYGFIYGESDEYELRKIKEHLEICKACAKEYALIEDILKQLRKGLPDDPIPDGFKERVLDRIHTLAAEGG